MKTHEIIATALSELAKYDHEKAMALTDMLIEETQKERDKNLLEIQESTQRINAMYS